MSRLAWAPSLLLLSAIALSSGCDFLLDSALSQAEAASYEVVVKEDDKLIDAALKGPNENDEVCVPMSEFFAKPEQYKLWAGDREAFKSLGEKCTAAGAPATYALVSKMDEGPIQMGASFAIALPTDKAARTKVFETYNQFWKDQYKAPQAGENKTEDEKEEAAMTQEELEYYLHKDVGQKYLYFSYDD